MFSGFFINSDSIPIVFDWIKYISFFRYAFRGTAVSVFKDLNLTCEPDELTNFTVPINVSIPVNISGMMTNVVDTIYVNESICRVDNGTDILDMLNLETDRIGVDIIFLATNIVLFNIIAYLALAFCKRGT